MAGKRNNQKTSVPSSQPLKRLAARPLGRFRSEAEKEPLSRTYFKQKLQDYHSGDNPPTESEWEQLKKLFSANHRSGYQLVTSSHSLTEEQIRVCLMTMLDISESMMAFALNTDRTRIDRVKRQANKKLFGEENASALKSNLRLYYP